MSIKFTENGISASLLDAVKNVTGSVSKYAAFGRIEEKKMDPVGKADDDIDNDGDVDKSDKYLHNRRKAIKKAMGGKKDSVEMNPKDDMKESKNEPSKENGGIAHMCASHVKHATYGEGVCIPGQHTLVETSEGEGYVTHYDVIFEGQIHYDVPVADLEIIKEASHMHSNVKKDKKKMIQGQKEGKESGLENPHNCATHVYSEKWGDGQPVTTMHADPDEDGNIAWYDVMFEHGVEKQVPIEELKVIKSSHHGHKKRGK